MSEPDAVPLPREGEVFFDVRGESRTMRLSWYADSSVAVFSIWQGNRCTSTFRLPFGDLARMVETLQAGPPSRSADQARARHGEPAYANAPADPGYGYAEQGGYGPPEPYGQPPGYGPAYGHGPDYGYQPAYDGPAGPADHGPGGQYYGDHERPAASAGYGPRDSYGAPGYLPDPAAQAVPAREPGPAHGPRHGSGSGSGHFQATSIYVHSAPRPQPPGYERTGSYERPRDYDDRAGQPEPAYPGQRYPDDHEARHRDRETQFLAAPPGSAAPYRDEAREAGWYDDRDEPAEEPSMSGYPGRPAKTDDATPDWGQTTASYRTR